MPRLLFEKTGNSVWISHLDLMRVFQRSFKRAGLPLTHTQGFNPRPSVSIALPLSVGIESRCELLDFDLDGEKISCEEIKERLNKALVSGIKVLEVYEECRKIKHLALLDCVLRLEYDNRIPENTVSALQELFGRDEVIVTKKGKNGVTEQNIRSMIRRMEITQTDDTTITIAARICCQNPTLNPMQISAAISLYLPENAPAFVSCCREEILDEQENIFR